MAGFTDFLELEVLDHIFGGADYARPATLYVGLSTTLPSEAGANISEPSGNGYARVTVTNNATNWPAASAGSKANGADITFPQASGSWGTPGYWFISDAASGGNVLISGAITVPKAIASGDTAKFAIGAIVISLD